MKAFNEHGMFWLPDNPSDKVPGVLNYDPVSGITLDLLGEFGIPPGYKLTGEAKFTRHQLILGTLETHAKGVLLENCSISSGDVVSNHWKRSFPYAHTSYTVRAIYHDVQFNDDRGLSGDLLFDKMYVEFPLLLQWVGVSGIRYIQDPYDPQISAWFEKPNEIKDSTYSTEAGGEVSFVFGWKFLPSIISKVQDEIKLTQITNFSYTSQNPRDWACLSRHVTAIARLLSVVFDKKISPSRVTLRQAGEWEYERLIEIFFRPTEYAEEIESREELSRIYNGRFNELGRMSYDALGGMSFVTKWLDIADKNYFVLSKLMSCKFGSMPYIEDKFHQARSAIEAYWVISGRGGDGKKSRPADKLLVDLVKEAGFSDVLKDPDSWAKSVEANRNGYSSHFQGIITRPMDGEKIIKQTNCLYYLTLVLLLKDAGVESSALDGIRDYVKRFQSIRIS